MQILKEVCGDKLLWPDIYTSPPPTHLPSPEALRGKILVKAKKRRQAPHEEALLGLASWLDGAIAIIDAASMGELRRTTSGMHDIPNISPFGPSMAGGHAGGAPLFSFGGGDKGTKRVAEGDAAEEGDASDEDEDGAGGKRRKVPPPDGSGGGT